MLYGRNETSLQLGIGDWINLPVRIYTTFNSFSRPAIRNPRATDPYTQIRKCLENTTGGKEKKKRERTMNDIAPHQINLIRLENLANLNQQQDIHYTLHKH